MRLFKPAPAAPVDRISPETLARFGRFEFLGADMSGVANLTVSGSFNIAGASVTQDTTGPQARRTRFGGYSVGAGTPGLSAIRYSGNADKTSSLTVTACGGLCLSLDTDKGWGFGLGFASTVSISGLGG